jgi:predicted protein tyrosine phosphatase
VSNLLFICSKNQWRSPTAEALFKNHPVHKAHSAGTSEKARIRVNEKMLLWADVVFVMERRHKQLLKERFPLALDGKTLIVMEIMDDYQFGDEELVEILKEKLSEYL